MKTWFGFWDCTFCGEKGDSSTIVYKVTKSQKVSLRCPKCGERILLRQEKREHDRHSEDTRRQA